MHLPRARARVEAVTSETFDQLVQSVKVIQAGQAPWVDVLTQILGQLPSGKAFEARIARLEAEVFGKGNA